MALTLRIDYRGAVWYGASRGGGNPGGYGDQDTIFTEGYIFLQQEHKTGVCEFRNVRIRRL